MIGPLPDRPRCDRPRIDRGFTLLEVVVALAVIALAMTALMRAGNQQVLVAQRVEARVVANWVLLNEAARLRTAGTWPATGRDQGEADMLERTWYWRSETQPTPAPNVRHTHIEVFSDPERTTREGDLDLYLGRHP